MSDRLSHEPETEVADLRDLIGIAYAIEAEAVRRYDMLAREMERLGANETAAAFQLLLEEERAHVDQVSAWATRADVALPPAKSFVWRLPADIAASWDDVAGSALLTPYRALAIAVANEERAFAYYAYIAAHADDPEIAAAAEDMAHEELNHAMRMRKERRRAYHASRPRQDRSAAEAVVSVADFESLVRQLQGEAAREHAAIAAALGALADSSSEALLNEMVAAEAGAAGRDIKPGATTADSGEPASAATLLYRAQIPLERLADTCEAVMASATANALIDAAQDTLSTTVARLAQISHRAEQLAETGERPENDRTGNA